MRVHGTLLAILIVWGTVASVGNGQIAGEEPVATANNATDKLPVSQIQEHIKRSRILGLANDFPAAAEELQTAIDIAEKNQVYLTHIKYIKRQIEYYNKVSTLTRAELLTLEETINTFRNADKSTDPSDAIDGYQKAIPQLAAILGDDSFEVFHRRLTLLRKKARTGFNRDVCQDLLKSLVRCEREVGSKHIIYAQTLEAIATILEDNDQSQEALQYRRDAEKSLSELDYGSWVHTDCLIKLAHSLMNLRKSDEALAVGAVRIQMQQVEAIELI